MRSAPAAQAMRREASVGDFDGKVVLVTGGGTGLGAAIAIGAAKRGAKAAILNYSRSAKEAEETAAAVRAAGAEAVIVQGDVAEDADCRRIAAAAERFGRIDALVNSAGITKHVPRHGDLDALSADDFLRLYAVNTVGPFQMIRACRPPAGGGRGPGQRADGRPRSRASRGIGSSVAYAASKGALNTMTLSLARALAPKIRVNAICPGFIDTRWFCERLRCGDGAEDPRQRRRHDAAAGGLDGRGHRRCRAVPDLGCLAADHRRDPADGCRRAPGCAADARAIRSRSSPQVPSVCMGCGLRRNDVGGGRQRARGGRACPGLDPGPGPMSRG